MPCTSGLTEAGMGSKGIVASTAGMAVLLQQGIGDTIRVSLTPEPGGDRTQEVIVAQQILQVIGLRSFMPLVTACPGCGRTTSTVFQKLAGDIQDHIRARMPDWSQPVRGRRDDDGGGDGLHRQRPGREQARRHRHQPARHRRGAGRPGLHRRPQGDDAARPRHRHANSRRSSRTTSDRRYPLRDGASSASVPAAASAVRSDGRRGMSDLRPVRGTRDFLPDDSRSFRLVEERPQAIASRCGYGEVATPIFEFTEVFARTLGDTSDIVTKEMYTFADRGGDSLTLRPENTAGIVRAFITNGLAPALPLRVFYRGPMFRYERPQKGRLRQFHQVGVELIGVADPLADVEVIGLAHDVLNALGLAGQDRRSSSTPWAMPKIAPSTAPSGRLSGAAPRPAVGRQHRPPGAQPAAHPRFQGSRRPRGDRPAHRPWPMR